MNKQETEAYIKLLEAHQKLFQVLHGVAYAIPGLSQAVAGIREASNEFTYAATGRCPANVVELKPDDDPEPPHAA